MNFTTRGADEKRTAGGCCLCHLYVHHPVVLSPYPVDWRQGKQTGYLSVCLRWFSNVGYMGYPVINAAMGERGVFYTAIYNLAFTLLVWSWVDLMTRNPGDEKGSEAENRFVDQLKRVVNPNLIALAIRFALFLSPSSCRRHFQPPSK